MNATRNLIAAAAIAVAGSASAMTSPAGTLDEIAKVTRSAPSVFYGLDGDVLTVGGNLDSQIDELKLVSRLERIEGVSHVISHVNTF